MLNVRLVSPQPLTAHVGEALVAAAGVRNVVIQPGVARRPDGDAVQFDVRDEDANDVLATLRAMGLYESGGVCVDRVEAALADGSADCRRRGALRRETAPVWEMVDAVIRAGQAYAPSFYILFVTAGLIATVGLVTNSQVLIVGAMVVGPEYNAIMGVAAGISSRHRGAVRDGLYALLWGFLATIVASLLFGLVLRASGKTPSPFLAGVRPVADFINSPDVFSVIVAVLAGIVGVVSLTEARVNALIGVFISITTIPAAASLGVSMAYQSWGEAGGSGLQLLVNVGLLIAVGAGGLAIQRRIWRARA